MSILIVALCLVILGLSIREAMIHKQLADVRKLLQARIAGDTKEPISLALNYTQLNRLLALVNALLYKMECTTIESCRKEKALKETIEGLSHDLRTPLTAIKGNLQLLEHYQAAGQRQAHFTVIYNHVNEMEKLVDTLWAYAYYSADDQAMVLSRINLTNLVAQCIADHVTQFEEKGKSVLFMQKEPIFVLADEEYCLRILHNLLQNCIDYSVGDVQTAFYDQADTVSLSIRNPVSPDISLDADRLFDRFYTADHVRTRACGLGLALVRQLTEKMGGQCAATLEHGLLDIHVHFPKDSSHLQGPHEIAPI